MSTSLVLRFASRTLAAVALALGIFGCVAVLDGCGLPPGRRLLSVDYEWNGMTVGETNYDDDCLQPADVVWTYLDAPPVVSAPLSADLPLASPDALRVTLDGAVTVRIRHVDSPIAECEVDGLVLVRDAADTGGWYLPPEELARTADAAGLILPE